VAVERKSNGGAVGLKVAGGGSSYSPSSSSVFFFFVFFHSALGLFLFSYSKSLSPLVFFYVFNYSKYPALFCFLHYLFPFFPSVSASLF
jgi:hypothetical protein